MHTTSMLGTLPPVDRVGGVVPVSRRDHPRIPLANEGPHKRDHPAGNGPPDDRQKAPAAPAEPELPEAPTVDPGSTFGNVVNTFAGPHCSSSSALMLL